MSVLLPVPTTKAVGDSLPNCPWCGGDMENATVRLADAFDALMASDGAAYLGGLEVDCPTCAKPCRLDAVVRGDEARTWLHGERTPADKQLLGEPT